MLLQSATLVQRKYHKGLDVYHWVKCDAGTLFRGALDLGVNHTWIYFRQHVQSKLQIGTIQVAYAINFDLCTIRRTIGLWGGIDMSLGISRAHHCHEGDVPIVGACIVASTPGK